MHYYQTLYFIITKTYQCDDIRERDRQLHNFQNHFCRLAVTPVFAPHMARWLSLWCVNSDFRVCGRPCVVLVCFAPEVSDFVTEFLFRWVHLVFDKKCMQLYSKIEQVKTCDFNL